MGLSGTAMQTSPPHLGEGAARSAGVGLGVGLGAGLGITTSDTRDCYYTTVAGH